MWPFKPREFHTRFYDPAVVAIRDPAVREWASRFEGMLVEALSHARALENQVIELHSRLGWKVDVERDATGRENPWLAAEAARAKVKAPFDMASQAGDKPVP